MGVRATAQMMTATRTTITDSVLLANAVMASHVLPAVRSRLPGARGESSVAAVLINHPLPLPGATIFCSLCC